MKLYVVFKVNLSQLINWNQYMEYQVLARKWRPANFFDMVGQEHITRTLQNALISNKTAHAYLFVGPRGIGKTSIARIFAKTLNCEKAPIANPCGVCDSCLSISDGNNIDIIEIDGASNNSVNDIRNLREEVSYTPARCTYKVYIIDEVHMLTNAAWNALLKTLEEPPPHVKFLFATTEPHKILPTVLSRCQRFDLKRIPGNVIVDRLSKISKAENVKISKHALRAISKAADGGMRDALSLLDQMIAFHLASDGKEISEEIVFKIFGLTATDDLYNLVASMLNDDKSGIILSIHKQSEAGINLEFLFNDILNCLRGIEICMLISNPDSILEVGSDVIEHYRKLGNNTSLSLIQKLLETLSPTGKVLHDSLNKQIYLETIILKSMRYAQSFSIDELISKINELKKNGQLNLLEAQIDKSHINLNRKELRSNTTSQSVVDQPISRVIPEKITEKSYDHKKAVVLEPKELVSSIKTQAKEEPIPEAIVHKTEIELSDDAIGAHSVKDNNRLEESSVQIEKDNIDSSKIASNQNVLPEDNDSIYSSVFSPSTDKSLSYDAVKDDLPAMSSIGNETPLQNNPATTKNIVSESIIDYDILFSNQSNSNQINNKSTLNSDIFNNRGIVSPLQNDLAAESLEQGKNWTEDSNNTLAIEPKIEKVEVNKINVENKFSPQELWYRLVKEMDNESIAKPQLKFYMQAAKPDSINNNSLTICYDEDFNSVHAEMVEMEIRLINESASRITGIDNFKVVIKHVKGIVKPVQDSKCVDLSELKEKIATNSFIKTSLDLFDGKIVDIKG